jgi:hypothetical protein
MPIILNANNPPKRRPSTTPPAGSVNCFLPEEYEETILDLTNQMELMRLSYNKYIQELDIEYAQATEKLSDVNECTAEMMQRQREIYEEKLQGMEKELTGLIERTDKLTAEVPPVKPKLVRQNAVRPSGTNLVAGSNAVMIGKTATKKKMKIYPKWR